MSAVTQPSLKRPEILSFALDLPNLCSLAGLLCAVLSIYFAVLGIYPAAMIGLIWAVFFDWSDGIVARRLKGRTDQQREFGGQLDSLIDIVSFGICPAIILLSYGGFSPWFVPGAFVIVAAGVLRLSFFNVFGLVDSSTYQGLALDNNAIALVFLFLFEGSVSTPVFAGILYVGLLALTVLNLSSLKTPKFGGWFLGIAAYTVSITLLFGWRLLQEA